MTEANSYDSIATEEHCLLADHPQSVGYEQERTTSDGVASTSLSARRCYYRNSALVLVVMLIASYITTIFHKSGDTVLSIDATSQAIDLLGDVHNSRNSLPSTSFLSERGQEVKPGRDDVSIFLAAAPDAYHPIDNPAGYLVMLVAENRLMYSELSDKLKQVMTTTEGNEIPEWAFDYGDMTGQIDFKVAVAKMMQSSWMKGVSVDPRKLVLQAGAGAILDSLAWCLADAGDGILVTAPAYSNFAGDFDVRSRVQLYVARTDAANHYEPTVTQLDDAFAAADAAGNPPKILVICQPNNPVGVIYTRAAMHRMIMWALKKGLHVVSDEIYGNSVFPGQHVTSAAHIMREIHANDERYLGDRVHIVAGLSKDWGMSGFRVGTLFSHNAKLFEALNTLSYYTSVSEYTQFSLTKMFQDKEWITWYLAEYQHRLETMFLALKDALALIGVSVFPSTGGIFAWADFSSFLRPGETEKDLWLDLFHEAKILLTAGESFFGDKPGMFRVVYTWPIGGEVAMQELGKRLVKWKAERERE